MNNSNRQHYKSGEKTGSNKKMSSGAKVGIIVLVIVLICMFGMGACSLMLVAIGSMSGNKSENNVEKVEKMVAEASGEEIPDELAGFYMGDDGSGMCIFENGDCTFYYTYLGNTKKYINLNFQDGTTCYFSAFYYAIFILISKYFSRLDLIFNIGLIHF